MGQRRLAIQLDSDAGNIEWSDKGAPDAFAVVCSAAKLADLKTAVPNIRRLGGPKNVAMIDGITLPSICDRWRRIPQ
jgi:hypothetical protein